MTMTVKALREYLANHADDKEVRFELNADAFDMRNLVNEGIQGDGRIYLEMDVESFAVNSGPDISEPSWLQIDLIAKEE